MSNKPKMITVRGTAAERETWKRLAWARRMSLNKLVRQLLTAEEIRQQSRRRRPA